MHAVVADWSGFEKSEHIVSTARIVYRPLLVPEFTYGGAAEVALALDMHILVGVSARTRYRALPLTSPIRMARHPYVFSQIADMR
jgi:hypothetical protein